MSNIEIVNFPTPWPRCLDLREVYINVYGQCMPCCDLSQGIKKEAWKMFFKEEWNLNYNNIDDILKSIKTFAQNVYNTKTSTIEKCSKTCINPWIDGRNFFHLELSTRCTLKCPKCPRTRWPLESPNNVFEKTDMKFRHVETIVNSLPDNWSLLLQGSLGDPVFHPRIFDIIRLIDNKKRIFEMTTASPARSLKWWGEFYSSYSNKSSMVRFSVDGLHDTAHIYRVGMNFDKVWEAMKLGAKQGKIIIWSFIPFSFNEHQIETAKQMASDNGIIFKLTPSNRWNGSTDPLRPKDPTLVANYDRGY